MSPFSRAVRLGLGSVVGTFGIAIAAEAVTVSIPDEANRELAIAQVQNAGYTVIYVNSTAGHDLQGNGSQMSPLRTIGHALRIAQPNTVIVLMPGVYSEATGERFPIQLRSGVTVQGAPGPLAGQVIIQGNASYVSRSEGLQNVTLVGADNAGLANVTVSNPHPAGHGLWIESGSPVILQNSFVRSGGAGVYIAGAGSPVIRNNAFVENGRAGLVINGPSSAQVQGNVFENTGTGISIAPQATPQIFENRITRNQSGLVLHADARPVLRNNQISQNRQNSLLDYAPWPTAQPLSDAPVAIAPPPARPASPEVAVAEPPEPAIAPAAQTTWGSPEGSPPASGGTTEPRAASPVAPAVPEPALEAAAEPAEAAVIAADDDLPVPDSAAIAIAPLEPTPTIPVSLDPEPAASSRAAAQPAEPELPAVDLDPPEPAPAARAPRRQGPLATIPAVPNRAEPESQADPVAQPPSPVVPDEPAIAAAPTQPQPTEPEPTAASNAADDAVALRARIAQRRRELANQAVQADNSSSDAVELTIIPPPVETVATASGLYSAEPEIDSAPPAPTVPPQADLPALPSIAANGDTVALPNEAIAVPGPNIPVGQGGSLPQLFVAGASGEGPPVPPSRAASLGLNYRVVVEAPNEATQARVRQVVADAFRVRVGDRVLMQVGAYGTEAEAQAQADRLREAGFRPEIQPIQ
ncbi:MAG: DUF1565 domain-containing protein [Leptolyngbyaceae cyanobacterium T60_A2020_046]|nr:DUF1565 domain-containing protein [Leptolyngbyaceae cyanobacterium T60_A2020_046]